MNENQPMTETVSRRLERVVGAFVVVALLLLVAGFAYYLYHTAKQKGWLTPNCPYFTFVESADGLKVGNSITMMGFDVGNITYITLQSPGEHKVYIGMEIRQPYYGYIWTDSKVLIAPAGLLGGRGLEITPGVTGSATVKEENGRVSELWIHDHWVPLSKVHKGVKLEPDEQPSLGDRAQKLVSTVEHALPNILSLTNQVYTVLTNTAELTGNANQLVTNMVVITGNLRDPHGSLGEWLIPTETRTNLDANLENLNTMILNLAAITSNLNAQVQSNDKMLSQISTLVVNTDNLVQGLKKQWFLRGVFQKMNSQTNAPPLKTQPAQPVQQPK